MTADFNRKKLRFKSINGRTSKVSSGQLMHPSGYGEGAERFADSLPDILAVHGLRDLATAILTSRRIDAARIFMYGGHVIKCGLGPLLSSWTGNGRISALATNGAGTIHDLEMALFGATSEDVEAGIADGSFGMWKETGELWARGVEIAFSRGTGLGAGLGMLILEEGGDPAVSPLAAACDAGTPITVHPALGGDIVHPHPDLDWGKLGTVCERDFDLLGSRIAELSRGVIINAGSAVVMPEVFLKLLTCARNLGHDVRDITAAGFDMMRPYRSLNNVLGRPVRALGGRSIEINGSHEVMLPLLDIFIDAEERRDRK